MTGKYNVILADPPWYYNSRKTVNERNYSTRFGGGADKHYPLMKDRELLGLAPIVSSLSSGDCALFMWATMPRLDFAVELLKEWGFRYATVAFTWIKVKKHIDWYTRLSEQLIYGPGYYTASNTEVVLLGVNGSMSPVEKMVPSVVIAQRGRHSQKPEAVQDRIERMYGGRKLEMFARRERDGWDCIGNQLNCDVESLRGK